jgi:hypothetical protein
MPAATFGQLKPENEPPPLKLRRVMPVFVLANFASARNSWHQEDQSSL